MAALLEDLETIGDRHEELFDTDVREHLWEAIEAGLIRQEAGFEVPAQLGMFSEEANAWVAAVLGRHIAQLKEAFKAIGLDSEEKRLASFFNPKLHTPRGATVDEFFGHP
jgi:hypothetical protein